eukprot:scaffold7187_cov22-Tisochrysis_lutea.AAC.1
MQAELLLGHGLQCAHDPLSCGCGLSNHASAAPTMGSRHLHGLLLRVRRTIFAGTAALQAASAGAATLPGTSPAGSALILISLRLSFMHTP